MKKQYQTYFLLLAVCALLFGGCGTSSHETESERDAAQAENRNSGQAADTPSQEETAPAQIVFEGQDMEGNEVSSDIFANSKLTMVNVWATYCNPCLREMPDLGALAAEYSADKFQIIGIISDVQTGADQETIAYASELITLTGADYPHLLLNESLYYALLTEVSAVPTTFFIDENGVILDTVIGSKEKAVWEEKINALLEEL